ARSQHFPYTTLFRSSNSAAIGTLVSHGLSSATNWVICFAGEVRSPCSSSHASTSFSEGGSARPCSLLRASWRDTRASEICAGTRSEEHTSELQSREN